MEPSANLFKRIREKKLKRKKKRKTPPGKTNTLQSRRVGIHNRTIQV
jgi:hypothetical protein